jgi:enoyl-[acyl-carrier-protein] reductase (NADH)
MYLSNYGVMEAAKTGLEVSCKNVLIKTTC